MNNQSLKKKELRKYFHEIRMKQISYVEDKIFVQLFTKLKSVFLLENFKGILGIYWPMAGEIDIRSLPDSLNVSCALPACGNDRSLSYHRWTKKPLSKDPLNIPAPLLEPQLKPESLDLILVPALAIDLNGLRLGYGGGYFDRLRSNQQWRSIPTVGVIPQACISLSPLPKESWDIPLDGWFTEKGFTSCFNYEISSSLLNRLITLNN